MIGVNYKEVVHLCCRLHSASSDQVYGERHGEVRWHST